MKAFKEWGESAVIECDTKQVNRNTTRDVYVFPNGIKVYHDVQLPWNFLKGQAEHVVVDFILPVSRLPEVEAAGGEITTDWYTEEGYGLAMFHGERAMERAYAFAGTLKEAA